MTEKLTELRAVDHPELLAAPVHKVLAAWSGQTSIDDVMVVEIDPEVADTAACCERYGFTMDQSANCVVVAGKRGEDVRYAACNVLATTRADVNGLVKRYLDVRKASFAPMDQATELSNMEYGGITPVGLPESWPVLVDPAVVAKERIVLGSGLRKSKLLVPGTFVADLATANVLEGLGRPA